MTKIVLNDLVNLENQTSAVNTINANNAVIETAFDNTLSRDGTFPNTMSASLDMNSNRVLNLPIPLTDDEPLRLVDLNDFLGGGTITNIPAGGSTNDVLTKASNANYDVDWSSAASEVIAGTNISVTGTSPATVSTVSTPTFTSVNKMAITAPATSSTLAVANGKTLTASNTLTLAGTDSTTLTFQGTDTYIGRATTDTLTNKTYDTQGAGNAFKVNGNGVSSVIGTGSVVVLQTSPTLITPNIGTPSAGVLTNVTGLPVGTGISGLAAGVATFLATPSSANLKTAVTDETGSGGSLVFATAPTITTPAIVGFTDNSAASAGNVGQTLAATAALDTVSMTTAVGVNVTSLSLTAGDWEVSGIIYFFNNNSTAVTTYLESSISTTSATRNLTVGSGWGSFAYVTGGSTMSPVGRTSILVSPSRISLGSTTTVYLVGYSQFTVNTLVAGGSINARRIR